MSSEQTQTKIFKAISNFVEALHNVFHDDVRLYYRLLLQTTILHEVAVNKHINAFKSFFETNKTAMEARDVSELKERIAYSTKVYIDIRRILLKADADTKVIIWKHMFNIWGHIDPMAKKLLEDIKTESTAPCDAEDDFIMNIMGKVEKMTENKKETADPMEAMTDLLQSGIISDMVSGLFQGAKNGNLNISKMLGSVQNLAKKISPDQGNGTEFDTMMSSMMGPMMSSMMASIPKPPHNSPASIEECDDSK